MDFALPFDLTTRYLRNPLEAWAWAVGLTLLVAVTFTLLKRYAQRRLQLLPQTEAGDRYFPITRLFGALWWPVWWVVAAYIAAQLYLDFPRQIDPYLGKILGLALLIQATLWVSVLFNHAIYRHSERKLKEEGDAGGATTLRALGFVGRIGLWAVALLWGLHLWDVDVTALVAGLGIGGIAIALAAQSVLGDLLASLSIMIDRPFVIGDFIALDEAHKGTIEHIGLRSTRVRSLSGEEIIVPNAELLKAKIRNYKRLQQRQVQVVLGLVHGTAQQALATLPQALATTVATVPLTEFERAYFKGFATSSLEVELTYNVLTQDYAVYTQTVHAVNLAILALLAQRGDRLAYPTQTVQVMNNA